MRVLHVASGDLWAGAEVMLHALATAQSRLPQTSVAVLLFNEGKLAQELRSDGVQVFVHPETSLNPLQLFLRTRVTIQAFKPDIVHTHRIKEDVIGALATFTSRQKAHPVHTVHGKDEVERASLDKKLAAALHRCLIRWVFQKTFAVSRSLAADLAREVRTNNVVYVANGIDLTRMPEPVNPALRSLVGRPIHIGLIGRLVSIKRVDLFIHAASILLQEDPETFRFTIYGDGPELEPLRALSATLGVDGGLAFKGFSSNVIREMTQLDMLFLTSDSEGLPMVVLEAMAVGLPVVVPAVGGLPEALDNGRCGTLITRQAPRAYAEVAISFRRNPEEFWAKADAARKRVYDQYSSHACAVSYMGEYRRLMVQRDSSFAPMS
jgi:glycosyltransferase involved in cell wall biosynthesis